MINASILINHKVKRSIRAIYTKTNWTQYETISDFQCTTMKIINIEKKTLLVVVLSGNVLCNHVWFTVCVHNTSFLPEHYIVSISSATN